MAEIIMAILVVSGGFFSASSRGWAFCACRMC